MRAEPLTTPRRSTWTAMAPADLPGVMAVAGAVHVDHPERDLVFSERLSLYPEGCFVLRGGSGIAGYAVSHPWVRGRPVPLDALIGAVPSRPTAFYIHDVAVLPAARGGGAGGEIVERLVRHAAARGFTTVSLVAVAGAGPFWRARGFCAVGRASTPAGYGDGAEPMERAP